MMLRIGLEERKQNRRQAFHGFLTVVGDGVVCGRREDGTLRVGRVKKFISFFFSFPAGGRGREEGDPPYLFPGGQPWPVHRLDFKSRENTSLQKEARANAVHTGPKTISLSKKVYSFLLQYYLQ